MEEIKRHCLEDGTGVTNFSIDRLPRYEATIEVYDEPGLYIGDPFGPLERFTGKYRALHIEKRIHPFYLSAFWRVFDTITSHPVYHSRFNAYQSKKHGFSRIN